MRERNDVARGRMEATFSWGPLSDAAGPRALLLLLLLIMPLMLLLLLILVRRAIDKKRTKSDITEERSRLKHRAEETREARTNRKSDNSISFACLLLLLVLRLLLLMLLLLLVMLLILLLLLLLSLPALWMLSTPVAERSLREEASMHLISKRYDAW